MDQINEVASGEFHKDTLSRWLLIVAAAAVALGVFGVGLLLVLFPVHVKEYDPLGPYPMQQVERARYHITDLVEVTARKCAKTDGVAVRGTTFWVNTNASGTTVSTTSGVGALRYKSCGPTPNDKAFHFKNTVPVPVREIVKAEGPTVWYLTGTETPYKPASGELGVPRTWTTDTFTLVP